MIADANAFVKPGAVMVKTVYTTVANVAVNGVWRSKDLASGTQE